MSDYVERAIRKVGKGNNYSDTVHDVEILHVYGPGLRNRESVMARCGIRGIGATPWTSSKRCGSCRRSREAEEARSGEGTK